MKRIASILFIVFWTSVLYAQNAIPFDRNIEFSADAYPERFANSQSANEFTIEYSISGAIETSTIVKGKNYSFLNINGFSHLRQVGAPALPMHNDIVLVNDSSPEVTVIRADYIEYDGYLIHPALKPARDTEGAKAPEFEIDSILYTTDSFFPDKIVSVSEILKSRGNNLALVQLCPVQYNPVSKKLRVYSRIQYTIKSTDPATGTKSATAGDGNSSHYLRYLRHSILNTDAVKETETINSLKAAQASANGKNYIIITHSEFQAAAKKLATWKRQLGYSVEIVSNSSWTASEVKDAIHSRFNTWDIKPDYFVILGDHDGPYAVPGEIHQDPTDGEDFATDVYYAYVDGSGDYFPDIAHGRISVNSASQAESVIQKIIDYERQPVNEASFYSNGVNCAQFQDDDDDGYAERRFTHTSEEIRDYLQTEHGYQVERIYNSYPEVTPTHFNNTFYSDGQAIPDELLRANGFGWDGDQTDILNSINAGKFYVFHRDHGFVGGSGWSRPRFTVTDISNLSNENKTPVVFSINCHTGEYQLDECFAEKFLRQENGGAVGVVAASYYSYSGYNDALSIGMVDAIWSDPGLTPDFGTLGNPNPTSSNNNFRTMGDVVNIGITRMIENWGDNSYSNELFHWFGDPAMRIWTENPHNNVITADATEYIDCSATSIIISNCNIPDALVTLVSNDSLLAKIQLVGGMGTMNFSDICSMPSPFTLTISNENAVPWVQSLKVQGDPIVDFDGNIYNTVKIGEQWWMAENLKTIHYADGTPLLDGTGLGIIAGDEDDKYWFMYDDDPVNKETYGLLYTWPATVNGINGSDLTPSDLQGVCPAGWHVPSDYEWFILENYLDETIDNPGSVGWRGTDGGTKLKEGGISGFGAKIGGNRIHLPSHTATYDNIEEFGYFWTSTLIETQNAWKRVFSNRSPDDINYPPNEVHRSTSTRALGMSVRCVKDEDIPDPFLILSESEIQMDAAENSQASFDISASVDWTISYDQEWLTISAESGSGDASIILTATENTLSQERVAIVEVTGSEVETATIIVTQDARSCLEYSKTFVQGWNWFSINISQDDMTPGNLLSCAEEGDYIKDQVSSATYFEDYGWFGSLTELDPRVLYKIRIANTCGISFCGSPVDVLNTPMDIVPGWNWIGYLPQFPIPVEEAMSSLTLEQDDYIKNLTSSTTYYDDFGWFGSLDELIPTEGYMMKKASADQLAYPVGSTAPPALKASPIVSSKGNDASFDPHSFEFNGTITARVYVDGFQEGDENDQVLAYVNGVFRGIAQAKYFDPAEAFAFPMMVYSNLAEGETITFKYYDAEKDKLYSCDETLGFREDMIVADAFESFELHVNSIDGVDDLTILDGFSLDVYPNPFSDKLQIEYSITEESNVSITAYDMFGKVVEIIDEHTAYPGVYNAVWNTEQIRGGVYFIYVTVESGCASRKVISIK